MRDHLAETTISLEAHVLPDVADADERLLEELYDTYNEPLFRYALMLTCSRDDAEDAVQVVFIRIAREWKRLVRVENVKAYLFSAIRNVAFNILRGRRRREALQESVCAAFQVDQRPADSGDQIESRIICEALDELPVDQREVLILKIFDEMTFKEIAYAVGASTNTVASRYRYGIEKLREALEANDNG
jgi:RNA polymerase sigma-70 factor (ECF subfamily)